MSLPELLAAARVRLVHAADREAVLDAAATLLACDEASMSALHESLLQREHACSTAIGHGIAIPQGRAPLLKAPRGALLRLQTAIDFVCRTLAQGILPRTLEVLDAKSIEAVQALNPPYRLKKGTGAAILVEVDGYDEDATYRALASRMNIATECGDME